MQHGRADPYGGWKPRRGQALVHKEVVGEVVLTPEESLHGGRVRDAPRLLRIRRELDDPVPHGARQHRVPVDEHGGTRDIRTVRPELPWHLDHEFGNAVRDVIDIDGTHSGERQRRRL